MEIEDDEKWIEFIINRELCERTKGQYRSHIKMYCETTKTKTAPPLTPTELIEDAINESEQGIHISRSKIRKRFIMFKQWLLEQDYKQSTRKKIMDHVRSFHHESEIQLPKVTFKPKPAKQISIEDLPTREEVYQAWSIAHIKYKAIILLMVSSGISAVDVRHITYKDFLKAIEGYYKPSPRDALNIDLVAHNLEAIEVIPIWHDYRRKNDIEYLTFSSPESVRYIIDYLKHSPPSKLDGPLFRTKDKMMRHGAFMNYFTQLNRRCKFTTVTNEGLMASHNLRRRFGSYLIEADVNHIKAEFMMGHKLPKTRESYFKMLSADSMKESYLNVLPHVTIIDEVEVHKITSEDKAEFDRMKETVARLEQHIQDKEDLDRFPIPEGLEDFEKNFLKK